MMYLDCVMFSPHFSQVNLLPSHLCYFYTEDPRGVSSSITRTQCLSHSQLPPKCLWQLWCLGLAQHSWQKTETHIFQTGLKTCLLAFWKNCCLRHLILQIMVLEKNKSPQKWVGNYSLLERQKCQARLIKPQVGFPGSSMREPGTPAPSAPSPSQNVLTGDLEDACHWALTLEPFLIHAASPTPENYYNPLS